MDLNQIILGNFLLKKTQFLLDFSKMTRKRIFFSVDFLEFAENNPSSKFLLILIINTPEIFIKPLIRKAN